MTEHTPAPFNPQSVAYAATALNAAVHRDLATVGEMIHLLLKEHGMPGAYDAIFTWCAAIRAHLRVPLGTVVTVVYVNDDGEAIPPPEDKIPEYVWVHRLVKAYVEHDKPGLEAAVAEMGDDPDQVKVYLAHLVGHAAEMAWASARQAKLS